MAYAPSTTSVKRSSTGGLALATAAGCLVAAPLFVSPPSASPALRSSVAAANVAVAQQQAVTSSAPSSFTAAAAATAIAGSVFAAASSKARTSLRAEAAATKEPPAPPAFKPSGQVGVTAPLGFFDPLNFTKEGDEAGFRKLRIAEIKHGRVAMMAAVGAVIQHYLQLPGFESVPKGLGAVTSMPGSAGFAVLFLISGAFELLIWKDDDPKKEPGNYGNPFTIGAPLGWNTDMRNFEINNGRMAMFSAVGIIAAELATGKDAIQQFS